MKARLGRERGDGPAAKIDVRHRHPGGELADRLGDEARREARQLRRDRELAARVLRRYEFRDAVDERVRGEMRGHAKAPRRAWLRR